MSTFDCRDTLDAAAAATPYLDLPLVVLGTILVVIALATIIALIIIVRVTREKNHKKAKCNATVAPAVIVDMNPKENKKDECSVKVTPDEVVVKEPHNGDSDHLNV